MLSLEHHPDFLQMSLQKAGRKVIPQSSPMIQFPFSDVPEKTIQLKMRKEEGRDYK
jgi:hypothetical protein